MSISIFKEVLHPKVKTSFSIKYTVPNSNTATKCYNLFFVVGRATDGGRFYSDDITDFNYAYKVYNLYKDMIKYFGGGKVELIACNKDGYDIIENVSV